MPPPYPPWYRCPWCHRVSHNRRDIEHRYCGHCHQFETNRAEAEQAAQLRVLAEATMAALIESGDISPPEGGIIINKVVIHDAGAVGALLALLQIPKG